MLADYLPSLFEGTLITLSVAGASLTIAAALGLLGAAAKLSRSRALRTAANLYTTVIRGVPDLVLMLLIFYGGQVALNWAAQRLGHEDYIDINPFVAGVATIGFIFGAYLTETFRGALMAIPPGQREAGLAFGMSPARVLIRITLPQMIRLALPGFTNNWLVLVKSTAIVSVIGLSDMMQRAGFAAGATQQPFTFYLAAAGLYLAITTVSLLALNALNRRYSAGVRWAHA
ncbi:MAG: ABC transporter permease [Betaproteobacteria bacterium]|nr:ABC transporter permease [Betaproteobacteria bacterium]